MMTLSFDLTCSSFAFVLYAILYTLVDYKQFWGGAPFIYAGTYYCVNCNSVQCLHNKLYVFFFIGTNPIFLYVGHILTKDLFPWSWKLTHLSHASVLAMNLWTTTLWAIVGYLLYRKDIIITI